MESLENRADEFSNRFFKGFVRYSEPVIKYVVKVSIIYVGWLYYGLKDLHKRFLRLKDRFKR
jgi:hypothetical protein